MKRVRACVWIASLSAGLLLAACNPRPRIRGPLPEQIRELEGYASLRITTDGETAKSRFSFVVEPQGRGRVEVLDALNRTAAEILAREDGKAYLILPRDKVFTEDAPEIIIDRFLGFPLALEEMAALISGRWNKELAERWTLEADSRGRSAAGRRADFAFIVREFFPESPVPRRLDFESGSRRGSLTLLTLSFNQPLRAGLFSADFLKTYAPKSWAEIEKLLRHED